MKLRYKYTGTHVCTYGQSVATSHMNELMSVYSIILFTIIIIMNYVYTST